jgi:hypothetical protein
MTLLHKKINIFANCKNVRNRMVLSKTSQAESSKEGCGSKWAVMPVMVMMMMMIH